MMSVHDKISSSEAMEYALKIRDGKLEDAAAFVFAAFQKKETNYASITLRTRGVSYLNGKGFEKNDVLNCDLRDVTLVDCEDGTTRHAKVLEKSINGNSLVLKIDDPEN